MMTYQQRYALVLSILYGVPSTGSKIGRYYLRKEDLRILIKGNVRNHWYELVDQIYHVAAEVHLCSILRTNEKAGSFALISVTLVDKWRHIRLRKEQAQSSGSLRQDVAFAAQVIRDRYRTLDLAKSEGLYFTGKELSQLIGRRLTYQLVHGIVEGGAEVTQLLADELGSRHNAGESLRLFAGVDPYLEVGGHTRRRNQSYEVFACVQDSLVKSWRRPVRELRDVINVVGKALDFPYEAELPGALSPPVSPRRRGRPTAVDLDALRKLLGSGEVSNANLARRLHVGRQSILRARQRLADE